MLITLNQRPGTGLTVSEALFGGNHLYTMNELSDGASFTQAVQQVGLSGVRYPGGAMTERWGGAFYDDPNSLAAHVSDADTFVGLDHFLNWAKTQGQAAMIVLPTSHLIIEAANGARVLDEDSVEQVGDFVADLLRDNPDVEIAGFEIGNEYWHGTVGYTSKEYGVVANAVAVAVQSAMDEVLGTAAAQPEILVQMGDQWGSDFEAGGTYGDANLGWRGEVTQSNVDVLEQLTDAARAAIDGVIEHYYFAEPTDTLNHGDASFGQTDRFFKEITWDREIWDAAFERSGHGPLSVAITEWGPDQALRSQWGLYSAGIVVEMFEAMMKLGADSAFVWPVEYNGTTDLAGRADGDDGAFTGMLTPIGEAFRLMADYTVGLELLNNGLSVADASIESVEINAFGSDDAFVVFLSSRDEAEQTITLDVSAYVESYASVAGERITLAEEGAGWNEARRFADTQDLSATDLMVRDTQMQVTLGAYEVVVVAFDLSDGRNRQGSWLSDSSDDDVVLRGNRKDNVLRGGDGDDTILGRAGRDRLFGSDGDDFIQGHRGNDRLIGGEGNDTLNGGHGRDLLKGGGGNDVLIGGRGRDKLIAGDGNDVLIGGGGADMFILRSGGDEILDFGRGADRINLRGFDLRFADLAITEVDGFFTRGAAREGVIVDYGQGAVFLTDVSLSAIGADDFVF